MTSERGFSISEAARELGVSAEWLRIAEKRGVLPPARRHWRNNFRFYTSEDVERLRRLGVGQRKRQIEEDCS